MPPEKTLRAARIPQEQTPPSTGNDPSRAEYFQRLRSARIGALQTELAQSIQRHFVGGRSYARAQEERRNAMRAFRTAKRNGNSSEQARLRQVLEHSLPNHLPEFQGGLRMAVTPDHVCPGLVARLEQLGEAVQVVKALGFPGAVASLRDRLGKFADEKVVPIELSDSVATGIIVLVRITLTLFWSRDGGGTNGDFMTISITPPPFAGEVPEKESAPRIAVLDSDQEYDS